MALNATMLGGEIKQAIKDAFADKSGTDEERSTRVWTNVAKAIVDHFKANAEVTPDGSPAMEAGGDAVTGKAKIT